LYAEIIIPLALPKNYTWSIPAEYADAALPGVRVEVVLGKNKKYAGIIKRIVEKPAAFDPKPILNVLDKEPVVHPLQIKLWEWMAAYYMCSEGEVMQAAVPANLKLSSETILIWNEDRSDDFSDLDANEYIVAEALLIKKELRLTEVQQLLDASNVYPVVKRLIDKDVCHVWENLKEKFKEKTEVSIRLADQYHNEDALADLLNNWSKAPKQLELLLAYLHLKKTEGEVIQTALLKKSGATLAQLKGLAEKNILIPEKRTVGRLRSLPKNILIDFEFSAAQQKAADEVNTAFKIKPVCLLHGVTSSGKTQLYIKLIEAQITSGKQVLYMLPEIALTSQIIRRLEKHFGGYIAIYHSKFNGNERVEIWNKVKAVISKWSLAHVHLYYFLSVNLGLIIVDEEHDASFKQQDPAPRYHARDAAVYYASLFNAKVLLGSATPSIESYDNALQGKYALAELTERYGEVNMPEIGVVDMKSFPSKTKLIVSPPLQDAITRSLEQKKQVILFQNRRGYSPYMICSTCGWIPHCEQCDVTLTYHKFKNKLTCHYCGTNYPLLQTCAACGSHHFVQKNFGTEKIEETIAEIFPDTRIARMDYDSVKGKNDHDTLIKLFEQHKVDILIGTQMVVKGLDFENVELVGIVDADGILNFADFRVNERAYQLMEQVSGRAGRKKQGKVLIQVNNTMHPVLQFVREHDYKALYDFEIFNRKQFFYPPYSRLIQVIFKHKEAHLAEEAANIFVQGMNNSFKSYITGPAEPVVNRVRNQYIREVLFKLPKDKTTIDNCKHEIRQQIIMLQTNKRYRAVTVLPDVDPV
jgi:primosomal protein N' (replication factor Y)